VQNLFVQNQHALDVSNVPMQRITFPRFSPFFTFGLMLCLSATALAQDPTPIEGPTPPEGMVLVPGGVFTMGSNAGDGLIAEDVRPQHQPNVPAFFLDKTEVTNAEYKAFCDATGYPVPPHWRNGNFPQGQENHPVVRVNWYEAGAYAAWKGKRLPTETEWEKAARGTDSRIYPWGPAWSPANLVHGQEGPSAVGSKPAGASPYGALDMAGNVYEWVGDWYDIYPGSPHKNAAFGTIFKVIRGGSFDGGQDLYKTTYRGIMRPGSRSLWVGFRCAKDAR
jgi:formylglycine-generating enzyme required for sulfatase activity